MRKLFVTISIVLVLAHQIQNSIAFDPIGTASSIIGLCQFFFDILQKFVPKDEPFDKNFAATEKFSKEVLLDTGLIIKYTEILPEAVRKELQEDAIEKHFANINQVFQDALILKSQLENDTGEIEDEYVMFTKNQILIDHDINEINRIFTGEGTYALGSNFMGNLKKFEDTCKTGMSDFQLLNTLLNNIRIATTQYFWAKKYMYDFSEISGHLVTKTRSNLWEKVGDKYTKVANKFLSLMANASAEVWKCDPEGGYDDSIRTKTSPDSNFAEIRAFSRYLLSQDGLKNYIGGLCGPFPCSKVTKYDECRGAIQHFCQLTHTCPGKLRCYQFMEKSTVCVNTNKKIPYRYHMFVPGGEGNLPSSCSGGDKKSWPTASSLTTGGNWNSDTCHYCNCICEESYEKNGIYHGFFVDNRRIMSDSRSNKIVVGARLVVEPFHIANASLSGQVLRIQISEAISLGNGAVGEGNWKKLPSIEKHHLIKIQWDKNRRFYLNPVMVGEDEVITGLAFNRRGAHGPAANDFVLKVFAHKVNFYTGVLDPSIPAKDYRNTKTLTEPLDMSNVDVPTRARMKNELLSSNDQYVDLSLSSDRLDGGQSTVPFIDSQKWEVKTPLAGASLYVRRQRGYGGFLSIKFHTFNTTKYVISQSKFMDLTDAQRLNLTTNFYNMSRIQKTHIEKNIVKTHVNFSNEKPSV